MKLSNTSPYHFNTESADLCEVYASKEFTTALDKVSQFKIQNFNTLSSQRFNTSLCCLSTNVFF